jgi:hypothetical protein
VATAAAALLSLRLPPSRYAVQAWSAAAALPRAPACRVNEGDGTVVAYRPPPAATPKTWDEAKAVAVLPETGDCYARSDSVPRPAGAPYWETGSATRLNSGACCCAFWDLGSEGGPKTRNASHLLRLDGPAGPTNAPKPKDAPSPFCVASFPAAASAASAASAPPVRVVICLSGVVRSAAELQCALASMAAAPGLLARPGGVAAVVHASVSVSSFAAVAGLLAESSNVVQLYELETSDEPTAAAVRRALNQCGNGALGRFVAELKRRHDNVLFDVGVDHSLAYM